MSALRVQRNTTACAMAVVGASLGLFPLPTSAVDRAGPVPLDGDAVLVVSGAIEHTSDGVAALFDWATLESLAGREAAEAEPCLVPLDRVLAHVGAHGDHLELRTLDDRRAVVSVVAGVGDMVLVLVHEGSGDKRRATVALGAVDADGRLKPGTTVERVVRIVVD